MLRILANEDVLGDAVAELQRRGHDVLWVRTAMPGATDEAVLERAVREQRLLETFDKDFGELVFRRGAVACVGIVLFRISTTSPGAAAERIVAILESRSDWQGSFSVVDDPRLRMVSLPGS